MHLLKWDIELGPRHGPFHLVSTRPSSSNLHLCVLTSQPSICQARRVHPFVFEGPPCSINGVVKLNERCLIACANYPEYWIRYVFCMEAWISGIMHLLALPKSLSRISNCCGLSVRADFFSCNFSLMLQKPFILSTYKWLGNKYKQEE